MSLGENIKTIRKSKKMSREYLSEKLGMSVHAIGKYEQDQRQPSPDTIRHLSEVFKVPVKELIDDGDNSKLLSVGKNIEKIRKSRKMSQRELGRRIGTTGQYISFLENKDTINPSLNVLENIASVLEVTVNDLMNRDIKEEVVNIKTLSIKINSKEDEANIKKLIEIAKVLGLEIK